MHDAWNYNKIYKTLDYAEKYYDVMHECYYYVYALKRDFS